MTTERALREVRTKGRSAGTLLVAAALAAGIGLTACADAGDAGGGEEPGADTAGASMAADTAAEAAGGTVAAAALLDPNEASEDELASVPGLPEEAADAILDGRPFADMVALDGALGEHLTEAERNRLYRRLWIPASLNEATDEEILLIPGVGDRMLGEFREYRPYRSMEQFRREIGKYVTDEELARLERYVRLGG